MKKFITLTLTFAFALVFYACKPTPDQDNPTPDHKENYCDITHPEYCTKCESADCQVPEPQDPEPEDTTVCVPEPKPIFTKDTNDGYWNDYDEHNFSNIEIKFRKDNGVSYIDSDIDLVKSEAVTLCGFAEDKLSDIYNDTSLPKSKTHNITQGDYYIYKVKETTYGYIYITDIEGIVEFTITQGTCGCKTK